MKKIVITAGRTFNDIDVLACAIAYCELLKLEGKRAEVVLPGPLNSSITDTIKNWGLDFLTRPTATEFNSVIVDISDEEHFAEFVKLDSVVEIYDHHFGFEKFWQDRLGKDSHIEPIGACATLIWEQYKARNKDTNISQLSANLLVTAILSNTLNFGAQITNERDRKAYQELSQYANLPNNWPEMYFNEVEKSIHSDIKTAILNDTKNTSLPSQGNKYIIGQLEIWSGSDFVTKYQTEIKTTLETFGEEKWFMNLISLSESKNYIYTENPEVQKELEKILSVKFVNNIGVTDKLWLRKEIIKKLH